VPKKVLAAEAIPMTALGKPDKKALRASFASPS
jgi:non-ribosomal peptide synthetase component E (peptide arylation enzyme)